MAQLVSIGDKTDFSIDGSGGLLYKNRLCVPNDMDLKKKILYESHNTIFTMHPGSNKIVPGYETVLLVARDEKGHF